MAKKKYALRPDQIKPLVEGRGGCIATDMITVDGRNVGTMYREEPDNDVDSGWRFLSGQESQAYMDEAGNHDVYDVNTIANYDPDIIPYLDAPAGCAFERQGRSRRFVQVGGHAWEPGTAKAAPTKSWPPPGFPLVEGHYALTAKWSMDLPEPFARRVEDGSLVLWRPGLTIWLSAWNNDHGESQATRLAGIKKSAAKKRHAEQETSTGNITRYSYRLRDDSDNGPVESLNAIILNDAGQLQLAVYFDDPADVTQALQLVDSVTERKRA